MVKTLFILAFFIAVSACGRDVSISTRKLQDNSALEDGSNTVAPQTGTLTRGTPDKISGRNVSIYSSYSALEFIAARPLYTQMQVKYKGKIVNQELVLESISAQ